MGLKILSTKQMERLKDCRSSWLQRAIVNQRARLPRKLLTSGQNGHCRAVISIVGAKQWKLYQLGVYNAFMQRNFYEEVYMTVLESFCDKDGNNGQVSGY